jgi:hypothetical protein
VALNLSDDEGGVDVGRSGGRVRVATRRERDGEKVGATLQLGPWEAAVVDTGA